MRHSYKLKCAEVVVAGTGAKAVQHILLNAVHAIDKRKCASRSVLFARLPNFTCSLDLFFLKDLYDECVFGIFVNKKCKKSSLHEY